jgi:hypothetical protein
MTRRLALLGLISLCLAPVGSARAQPAADKVTILSVEPSGPLPADVRATFIVVVEATLVSRAKAVVALGFNQEKPFSQEMNEERQVVAGTQTVRITAEATPRDWGRLSGFGAHVILRPDVTTGVFQPLAFEVRHIPVQPKKKAVVYADSFGSLTEPAKLAALEDIASAVSDLEMSEVVAVVQAAFGDANRQVRLAAVEAIDGRTKAADMLRVRFRPGQGFMTDGRRELPPPGWKDDGDDFRAQFLPTLMTMARRDDDAQIRATTVSAINNMLRLQRPEAFNGEPLAAFAHIYANDASAEVRAQVVQAFAYSASDDPRLRDVLKAAFADREPRVRIFANVALRFPEWAPRLRYPDVRAEITAALADNERAYRAAALDAVSLVPQDARELLTLVGAMSESDPDAAIRKQAGDVLRSMK